MADSNDNTEENQHGSKKLTPEEEAIRKTWESEQLELKKQLILKNAFDWGYNSSAASTTTSGSTSSTATTTQTTATTTTTTATTATTEATSTTQKSQLKYVAGVDISFVKGNEVDACACVVVLSWPKLEVIHTEMEMIQLTLPYIPTFLAFREVGFLVKLIQKIQKEKPDITPQLIFVDGNGFLHPRGFGIACHLGVLTDIPTIGVGKTLLFVDGITKNSVKKLFTDKCKRGGDFVNMVGDSGTIWGAAFKSTDDNTNPIFVSIGHRVDLPTAVELSTLCCKFRIPEPVRQADILSREFIRKNYKPPKKD